jgi:SAM-dependent methyltransferase
MFTVAEAYERDMGRWSKLLAPLFVEFVGVGEADRVLDVGCGTGSLTETVARIIGASKIVGIDPSKGFIDYARSHKSSPRVTFESGDAQSLRYPDASFDRCLALLILNFIPDPPKAAAEMRRVTRSGGVVGTAMWDNAGGNELNRCLWDAAIALDPKVKGLDEKFASYGSPEALKTLWAGAGLTSIEVIDLTFPCEFSSFDEMWFRRYLEGQGPGGAYVMSLQEDRRDALRQKLRQNILAGRSDGPFTLRAKAWAVRGIAP